LAVSESKLADLAIATGDPARGRAHLEKCLAARLELGQLNPGDAGVRRDLAVCLERLGIAADAMGDKAAARLAWEQELRIAEHLRRDDPRGAGGRRFVAVVHAFLASLEEEDASTHQAKALELLQNLHFEGLLDPKDAPLLTRLKWP
jgi:hypothetical protein